MARRVLIKNKYVSRHKPFSQIGISHIRHKDNFITGNHTANPCAVTHDNPFSEPCLSAFVGLQVSQIGKDCRALIVTVWSLRASANCQESLAVDV
jgi:hypothetical protein